ncbi:DUF1700 domain-containing protein [Romboutsia sp. MSSM.1001216sp_RTP31141st1_G3_RTP31141_220114]|uniref:DUF1700 domain-containing protein n=1 Tax=unclassified Romboutsia TaxID=2626894 RepID=UPI0031B635DF
MNKKEEFLKGLELEINSLPKDYIYDIINDYIEYFEDGKLDGKSEIEIIKELGNIDYIANSILSEYYIENPNKVNDFSTFMKALKALNAIGVGALSLLVGVPIIASFLLCYLSLYILSFSFIVMPLALAIHLGIPKLPISFGTDILWQKILVTGVLFIVGIKLLNILEKGRKKAFSLIFNALTKNIKHTSLQFKNNTIS